MQKQRQYTEFTGHTLHITRNKENIHSTLRKITPGAVTIRKTSAFLEVYICWIPRLRNKKRVFRFRHYENCEKMCIFFSYFLLFCMRVRIFSFSRWSWKKCGTFLEGDSSDKTRLSLPRQQRKEVQGNSRNDVLFHVNGTLGLEYRNEDWVTLQHALPYHIGNMGVKERMKKKEKKMMDDYIKKKTTNK